MQNLMMKKQKEVEKKQNNDWHMQNDEKFMQSEIHHHPPFLKRRLLLCYYIKLYFYICDGWILPQNMKKKKNIVFVYVEKKQTYAEYEKRWRNLQLSNSYWKMIFDFLSLPWWWTILHKFLIFCINSASKCWNIAVSCKRVDQHG